MHHTSWPKRSTLLIALCGIGMEMCVAQPIGGTALLDVTIAPQSSAVVSANVIDPTDEPPIPHEEKLRLIRNRVKYVFVLFQENRSFDFYFGSYPGGLPDLLYQERLLV